MEHQQWDIVSGVGITALAVAGGRALETRREDRLIDDPFAEPLFAAAGSDLALPQSGQEPQPGENQYVHAIWQWMANWLGVRSHYFDEFFAESWKAGARQAVILASGLDARAYRLPWPDGFRVFEIDQPEVLKFKDTVLDGLGSKPTCERHPVGVDLRDDWSSALEDAGFDPSAPTAWLAEGLLAYLPAAAERQLLETVTRFSAPGSRLAFEASPRALPQDLEIEQWMQDAMAQLGIDFLNLVSHEQRPETVDSLRELGWQTSKHGVTQIASGLDRDLSALDQVQSGEIHFLIGERP